MAPKVKGRAITQDGPEIVQYGVRVQLSEISLDADVSGHRDHDTDRQNELYEEFEAGRFGQNVLRGPAIIQDLKDTNGLSCLQDGLQTVAALVRRYKVFSLTVFCGLFVNHMC